jgi:hypothetical protein
MSKKAKFLFNAKKSQHLLHLGMERLLDSFVSND